MIDVLPPSSTSKWRNNNVGGGGGCSGILKSRAVLGQEQCQCHKLYDSSERCKHKCDIKWSPMVSHKSQTINNIATVIILLSGSCPSKQWPQPTLLQTEQGKRIGLTVEMRGLFYPFGKPFSALFVKGEYSTHACMGLTNQVQCRAWNVSTISCFPYIYVWKITYSSLCLKMISHTSFFMRILKHC
jgi:hypothetical protein